jgi:hypothetical protein
MGHIGQNNGHVRLVVYHTVRYYPMFVVFRRIWVGHPCLTLIQPRRVLHIERIIMKLRQLLLKAAFFYLKLVTFNRPVCLDVTIEGRIDIKEA